MNIVWFTVIEANWEIKLKWMDDRASPFRKSSIDNLMLDSSIDPLKFYLQYPTTGSEVVEWANNEYTVLYVNFTFERRLMSSIVTVYIPSGLVVLVSWVSFYIDVDAVPGRVTLGVMSVLAIITQILDTRKVLPTLSYVLALDIWLFACLVFVFVSLIEYCLAYILAEYPAVEEESPSSNNLVQKPPFSARQVFANEKNRIGSWPASRDPPYQRVTPGSYKLGTDQSQTPTSYNGDKDMNGQTMACHHQLDLFWVDLRRLIQSLQTWCDSQMRSQSYRRSAWAAMAGQQSFNAGNCAHKVCRVSSLDHISRCIFPIAFFIFTCMYWVYYLWYNQL